MRIVIERRWLLLIAGLMWTVVGVMLCKLAYGWLSEIPFDSSVLFGCIGVVGSLAIYRFGFTRTAARNIRRISAMAGKVSPLSFQTGRSYALIVFMMGLGIALRSSPIPKLYLASLYIAIGGGLFWSSFGFYAELGRKGAQTVAEAAASCASVEFNQGSTRQESELAPSSSPSGRGLG